MLPGPGLLDRDGALDDGLDQQPLDQAAATPATAPASAPRPKTDANDIPRRPASSVAGHTEGVARVVGELVQVLGALANTADYEALLTDGNRSRPSPDPDR